MREFDEYLDCVGDLAELEEIKQLDEYSQHLDTSRLEHSVNVSYFSYRVCKKFGWDYVSAARAGLLHDLYYYDWRYEKQPEGRHASAHPIVALRNARKLTEINDIEADAIVKHMWPMTIRFPRYKESYVVNIADKLCAAYEFTSQTGARIKRILQPAAV